MIRNKFQILQLGGDELAGYGLLIVTVIPPPPFSFRNKSPGIVRQCGKILWQTWLFTFVVGATVLFATRCLCPSFSWLAVPDSSDSSADICYNESSDGNRFAKWWTHNGTGAVPQTFLEISRWDLKIEHLNRLGRGERIYSAHTEAPFCSYPHPTPTSLPTPFSPSTTPPPHPRWKTGRFPMASFFFYLPPEHLPGDRPLPVLTAEACWVLTLCQPSEQQRETTPHAS